MRHYKFLPVFTNTPLVSMEVRPCSNMQSIIKTDLTGVSLAVRHWRSDHFEKQLRRRFEVLVNGEILFYTDNRAKALTEFKYYCYIVNDINKPKP